MALFSRGGVPCSRDKPSSREKQRAIFALPRAKFEFSTPPVRPSPIGHFTVILYYEHHQNVSSFAR